MLDLPDTTPPSARSRSTPSGSAPRRRTVVAAAAWAVPAVLLSTSSPALAASGRALTFSSSTYSGVACATIDDAIVRVFDGALAVAGASVVLQLTDGYTFDGGAVTSTVVTGADGSVACGTIHVPASGTGTIAASSAGAAGSTATLRSFDARLLASPSGLVDASSIPVGATPIAVDLFLSAGTLYRSAVGAVATGIAATGALAPSPVDAAAFLLPLRLDDGTAAVYDTSAGSVSPRSGVPSGATPLAADLFVVGQTIRRGTSTIATDVDTCGQLMEHDGGSGSSGRFFLPYRAVNGTPRLLSVLDETTRTAFEYGAAGGPPSGAQPVADDLFFANGSLYRVSWDGTSAYGTGVLASGIASWGTLTPNPYYAGERLLPVITTSGDAALFMVSGNAVRTATGVPTGATAVGADLFHAGSSIYQDAVGVVASDVSAVGLAAPASRSASRVIVPLSAAVTSC